MLNSVFSQPLSYFCLAAIVLGLALYISPKNALVKKVLLSKASQKGMVATYFPLLTSVVVSFILTLLLKIFHIS